MIGKLFVLMITGFLVVTTLKNHSPVEDDAKMIEGDWVPVSFELSGKKLPEAVFKDTRLILNDGHYTYQNDQGTYKLVPVEKFKAMDITGIDGPNKGKTFPAIYELTGDTLRICYDLEGKTRPSEFSTQTGTKQFLASYKRAKS